MKDSSVTIAAMPIAASDCMAFDPQSRGWNSQSLRHWHQGNGVRRLAAVASCALGSLLGAGCAQVDVYKIGIDGKADGPSGVRYYRPRPYVSVHEPFIVSARAYLVNGQVSPDGKFVLITDATDKLDGTLRATLGGKIEGSRVLLAAPPAASGTSTGRVQSTPDTPTSTPPEKTGQGQFKVVNDNSAFAVQPLRRYADIVYLPDFEQEFVVQVTPRFGNATAQLDLGQGWSMQGLDMQVDNNAITSRLFALFDESTKIALQLGKAALGIPGVPGGAVQAAKDAPTAAQLPSGTNVTIKVTIVRIVAPGIYPILKPAEGKFVMDNIGQIRQMLPDIERRLLIPVYPMTNVAFNTYESVVLEAAPATGDSPLRLQQYIDTAGAALAGSTHSVAPTANLQDPQVRTGLEKAIASSLATLDASHTYTVTITADSSDTGKYSVSVEPDDGAGSLSPSDIDGVIQNAAKAQGVKLRRGP